jgi:hypothetical protein
MGFLFSFPDLHLFRVSTPSIGERTPGKEGLLTHMKLVSGLNQGQTGGQDGAFLAQSHV